MWDFFLQHWRSGVEILILAVLIYHGYIWIRGTRGARILAGLVAVLLTLTLLSEVLKLEVIGWLLRSFSVFLALSLVVIFQPELRRALAEIGASRLFQGNRPEDEFVDQLIEALAVSSKKRFGALVAIERSIDLTELWSSGVVVDAEFSKELLLAIFQPKGVLHDGGMVLRDRRIHAAACVFPVSQREFMDRSIGLRHRAAIGVTEESDAVVLVVSEETGALALAHAGNIERNLSPQALRERLIDTLTKEEPRTALVNREE